MASIVAQLESLLETDVVSLQLDSATQRKALQLAKKLVAKLESPMETVIRMVWSDQAYQVALRICINAKVFEVLAKTNDFVTVKEIAEETKMDPLFLRRLLTHLAACGSLREKELDLFASTALSNGLTKPEVSGGLTVRV
jgi:hypothetical protein